MAIDMYVLLKMIGAAMLLWMLFDLIIKPLFKRKSIYDIYNKDNKEVNEEIERNTNRTEIDTNSFPINLDPLNLDPLNFRELKIKTSNGDFVARCFDINHLGNEIKAGFYGNLGLDIGDITRISLKDSDNVWFVLSDCKVKSIETTVDIHNYIYQSIVFKVGNCNDSRHGS